MDQLSSSKNLPKGKLDTNIFIQSKRDNLNYSLPSMSYNNYNDLYPNNRSIYSDINLSGSNKLKSFSNQNYILVNGINQDNYTLLKKFFQKYGEI